MMAPERIRRLRELLESTRRLRREAWLREDWAEQSRLADQETSIARDLADAEDNR